MPVLKIKTGETTTTGEAVWKTLNELTLSELKIGTENIFIEQEKKVNGNTEKKIYIQNINNTDPKRILLEDEVLDKTIDKVEVYWDNTTDPDKLYIEADDKYFITNKLLEEREKINYTYNADADGVMDGEYSLQINEDTTFEVGQKKVHCFVTAKKNNIKITLSGNIVYDGDVLTKTNNLWTITLSAGQTLEFNTYYHNEKQYLMTHLWNK